MITAATGTLAVAAAVSAVCALPGAAAPASTADAYVTSVSQGAGEAQIAAAGSSQQVVLFDRARLVQREQAAAAAKAAAARAAARKAAALRAAQAAARRRAAARRAAAQQAQTAQAAAVTTPSGSPQQIAEQMLGQYGWSSSQFSCLVPLWEHESGWDVTAENPSSGAYGIPQALPGAAMASAGPDWQTDAATQIRWGLTYIQGRYGSPCGAWAHEEADGWY